MSASPGPLYNLAAARRPEQRAYMRELEAAGICVFCPQHVERYHRAPVAVTGAHWYVTENDYPYAGSLAHYLIVSRRHVLSFDELPDAAGAELWNLRRKLSERHRAAAFATVERSGDMLFNGGSVAHLHVHFVALPEQPAETVRFRLSARAPGDAA